MAVPVTKLDAWLARTWVPRQQQTLDDMLKRRSSGIAELVRQSQQLRNDKRDLMVSVNRNLAMLKQQCEQLRSLTAAAKESRSLWSAGAAEVLGKQ